ncbi:unnamed protein product, partial [Mesorhabditis spiculigera]
MDFAEDHVWSSYGPADSHTLNKAVDAYWACSAELVVADCSDIRVTEIEVVETLERETSSQDSRISTAERKRLNREANEAARLAKEERKRIAREEQELAQARKARKRKLSQPSLKEKTSKKIRVQDRLKKFFEERDAYAASVSGPTAALLRFQVQALQETPGSFVLPENLMHPGVGEQPIVPLPAGCSWAKVITDRDPVPLTGLSLDFSGTRAFSWLKVPTLLSKEEAMTRAIQSQVPPRTVSELPLSNVDEQAKHFAQADLATPESSFLGGILLRKANEVAPEKREELWKRLDSLINEAAGGQE